MVLIATHDPVLALMAQRRIVFQNGAMFKVIESSNGERKIAKKMAELDHTLNILRTKIRNGEIISEVLV